MKQMSPKSKTGRAKISEKTWQGGANPSLVTRNWRKQPEAPSFFFFPVLILSFYFFFNWRIVGTQRNTSFRYIRVTQQLSGYAMFATTMATSFCSFFKQDEPQAFKRKSWHPLQRQRGSSGNMVWEFRDPYSLTSHYIQSTELGTTGCYKGYPQVI